MRHFRLGDHVRITGLPGSPWQDRTGTIVEIFGHGPYEVGGILQECAVDIGSERRWFMATHLEKKVPGRLIRFFRAEVLDRWPLKPDDVDILNGSRDQLVGLLCDRLSFSLWRAAFEVDDFYTAFNNKIASAIEPSSAKQVSLSDEEIEAIHIEMTKLKNHSSKNVA